MCEPSMLLKHLRDLILEPILQLSVPVWWVFYFILFFKTLVIINHHAISKIHFNILSPFPPLCFQ